MSKEQTLVNQVAAIEYEIEQDREEWRARVLILETELAALRKLIPVAPKYSERVHVDPRVQTPEQSKFEIQQLAASATASSFRNRNGLVMIDVRDLDIPTWKLSIWAKRGYIAKQNKHLRWMKKDVGRCLIAVWPDVLA